MANFIPKSQITVKYTDGSSTDTNGLLNLVFETADLREIYVGYYIETNNGEYFAGIDNINLGRRLQIREDSLEKNETPTTNILKFNIFNNRIKEFLKNTTPIPTMKSFPQESDYLRGYFYRFFAKRINSSFYQEIDEDTFKSIRNREKKYDYNLYQVGNIKWYLIKNVYQTNANSLKIRERRFPNISYLFPLLNEFFKPDTLKLQENLTTEGGLLYTADGEEYIGLYHIHPTGGPMIGAVHSNIPHARLYYINQLPFPGGISYEEWLQSQESRNDVYAIPSRDVNENVNLNESYTCTVVWVPPTNDYKGLLNAGGLMPGGTSCIDPGDGTGIYSYNEYGTSALSICEENCSSLNLNSTTNIGCLYNWDPNYCNDCNVHQEDMCGSGPYYNYQSQGSCSCGVYNKTTYYSVICCNDPTTNTFNNNVSLANNRPTGGETSGGGGSGY